MNTCDTDCACDPEIRVSNDNPSLDIKDYIWLILSFLSLIFTLVFEYIYGHTIGGSVGYILSYFLAGYNVLFTALKRLKKGDFFNEFVLMSVATLGAFYIGEYLEAVGVMLFYAIGELIQNYAVKASRKSVVDLLEAKRKDVQVLEVSGLKQKHPEVIKPGEIMLIKPGEMIQLDGVVVSETGWLDQSNITGESLPLKVLSGDSVLSGAIAHQQAIEVSTIRPYSQSYTHRMLALVENAANRKSNTQRLISRLARYYTPIVFFLAIAIIALPYWFYTPYNFEDWLYRGLVFLVISCPCAFMIAIPLSYFGGIGLAARKGILIKGGLVIDALVRLKAFVFDKTGTLTDRGFSVSDSYFTHEEKKRMAQIVAIEKNSTHPLSAAIVAHFESDLNYKADRVNEYPGMGIEGWVNGDHVCLGQLNWLKDLKVIVPKRFISRHQTTVYVAVNGDFSGYISLNNQLKPQSRETIAGLKSMGIKHFFLLSGDQQNRVEPIKEALGLSEAFGDLLPENKLTNYDLIREKYGRSAFVGDGLNDAPAMAAADVGIALGASGSDLTIETSDVVIHSENPLQVIKTLAIARKVYTNVKQNLGLVIAVKMAVLLLGAFGAATLWEAIFADVGVALLAVLNAYRLKYA